jgi:hypothetical protein
MFYCRSIEGKTLSYLSMNSFKSTRYLFSFSEYFFFIIFSRPLVSFSDMAPMSVRVSDTRESYSYIRSCG